eukprot:COSAG02_NODE_5454_length_4303_cov_5.503330_5_plen_120_part_00
MAHVDALTAAISRILEQPKSVSHLKNHPKPSTLHRICPLCRRTVQRRQAQFMFPLCAVNVLNMVNLTCRKGSLYFTPVYIWRARLPTDHVLWGQAIAVQCPRISSRFDEHLNRVVTPPE